MADYILNITSGDEEFDGDSYIEWTADISLANGKFLGTGSGDSAAAAAADAVAHAISDDD